MVFEKYNLNSKIYFLDGRALFSDIEVLAWKAALQKKLFVKACKVFIRPYNPPRPHKKFTVL
jgi:hypothetical protein